MVFVVGYVVGVVCGVLEEVCGGKNYGCVF